MKILNIFKIALILLILPGTFLLVRHHISTSTTHATNAPVNRVYRIAIFEPVTHPAIQEIAASFRQTLQQDKTHEYRFTVYNANGNKTLMRAQAEEIVHGNYDLLFSISGICTQLLAELTQKKHLNTPLVFAAVDDPVAMRIVQSHESSGNNITGVLGFQEYGKQLELLKKIKPTAQHILLVYNPSNFVKAKKIIDQIIQKLDLSLDCVEVYETNELQTKVEARLSGIDTLLILTDNTIVSAIDILVKLCNRYGVTLYASDLNSSDKGAALAFGVKEADYGIYGAQQALLILNNQRTPTTLPLHQLETYKLKINPTRAIQQGLPYTPEQLARIRVTEHVEVIEADKKAPGEKL